VPEKRLPGELTRAKAAAERRRGGDRGGVLSMPGTTSERLDTYYSVVSTRWLVGRTSKMVDRRRTEPGGLSS
jgi:hypothetical protein